jgi:acetylornithine deacetylase
MVRATVGGAVDLDFEEPYLLDPALETPTETKIAQAVVDGHLAEFGKACDIHGAHYCTDGSKLALAGIETVICGPGDIAQAHTSDEFVEVEQLESALRLYRRIIANWS